MKTTLIHGRLGRFLRAKEAVSALEYAILVGVIATGVAAAVATFQTEIATVITDVGEQIDTAAEVGVGTGNP